MGESGSLALDVAFRGCDRSLVDAAAVGRTWRRACRVAIVPDFTVSCNLWSWNVVPGKYCGAVETNLFFRLEMLLTLCGMQVRPG